MNLTRQYQARKGLQHNIHLWPLALLPATPLQRKQEVDHVFFLTKDYIVFGRVDYLCSNISGLCWFCILEVMRSCPLLSQGQAYTGIRLSVYKRSSSDGRSGLLLTSFQNYSFRCASFQQISWSASLHGLPVWSQSGGGDAGRLGQFPVSSSHNPYVQQRNGLLMMVYDLTGHELAPKLFGHKVRLFWPEQLFDETIRCMVRCERDRLGKCTKTIGLEDIEFASPDELAAYEWVAGRKGTAYIAALATASTVMNRSHCSDATLEMRTLREGIDPNSPDEQYETTSVCIPRRECLSKRHCWVVVTGVSSKEIPSLEHFVRLRCGSIAVEEINWASGYLWSDDYRVKVSDLFENNTLSFGLGNS